MKKLLLLSLLLVLSSCEPLTLEEAQSDGIITLDEARFGESAVRYEYINQLFSDLKELDYIDDIKYDKKSMKEVFLDSHPVGAEIRILNMHGEILDDSTILKDYMKINNVDYNGQIIFYPLMFNQKYYDIPNTQDFINHMNIEGFNFNNYVYDTDYEIQGIAVHEKDHILRMFKIIKDPKIDELISLYNEYELSRYKQYFSDYTELTANYEQLNFLIKNKKNIRKQHYYFKKLNYLLNYFNIVKHYYFELEDSNKENPQTPIAENFMAEILKELFHVSLYSLTYDDNPIINIVDTYVFFYDFKQSKYIQLPFLSSEIPEQTIDQAGIVLDSYS